MFLKPRAIVVFQNPVEKSHYVFHKKIVIYFCKDNDFSCTADTFDVSVQFCKDALNASIIDLKLLNFYICLWNEVERLIFQKLQGGKLLVF